MLRRKTTRDSHFLWNVGSGGKRSRCWHCDRFPTILHWHTCTYSYNTPSRPEFSTQSIDARWKELGWNYKRALDWFCSGEGDHMTQQQSSTTGRWDDFLIKSLIIFHSLFTLLQHFIKRQKWSGKLESVYIVYLCWVLYRVDYVGCIDSGLHADCLNPGLCAVCMVSSCWLWILFGHVPSSLSSFHSEILSCQ